MNYLSTSLRVVFVILALSVLTFGQTGGKISGKITFGGNGTALGNASVQIVQLKRTVSTDGDGVYEFRDVPPGRYTILVHQTGFGDNAKTIVLSSETGEVNFQLQLIGVKEQVTVTSTGTRRQILISSNPSLPWTQTKFSSVTTAGSAMFWTISPALQNALPQPRARVR